MIEVEAMKSFRDLSQDEVWELLFALFIAISIPAPNLLEIVENIVKKYGIDVERLKEQSNENSNETTAKSDIGKIGG